MFAAQLLCMGVTVLAGAASEPIAADAYQITVWDANAVVVAYVPGERYLVGEPIPFRVEVHNLGDQPVYVRDNQSYSFSFSARHSSGNMAQCVLPAQISVWSGVHQLERGRDFNDVFYLNEHLAFDWPGRYDISYRAWFDMRNTRDYRPSSDPNCNGVLLSGNFELTLCKGSKAKLEQALRAYLEPLRSTNYKIKKRAARAFMVAEPKLAVKLLKQAINEDESAKNFAGTAVWAIARIGTDKAVETLREMAENLESPGRKHAISELGRFHFTEGKPTLLALLSDEDPRVRIAALRALRSLADISTIPQIETSLADPEKTVRQAAETALKALTKKRDEKQRPRESDS